MRVGGLEQRPLHFVEMATIKRESAAVFPWVRESVGLVEAVGEDSEWQRHKVREKILEEVGKLFSSLLFKVLRRRRVGAGRGRGCSC